MIRKVLDRKQLQNKFIRTPKKIDDLEHEKAKQKLTEEKLVKSKKWYRLIIKNTNDVITLHCFNLLATFTYISPSIKNLFIGYKQEELLGKSPFEFIHPDDKGKIFLLLKKYINAKADKLLTAKESSISEKIEYRFKDKAGNWRYFQSIINIMENQLLFITRDLSAQKKAEEALRISQEEFANLFKSIPEALAYLDNNFNLLDINSRFTDLFGYTLKEIKGRNIDDGMIHPLDKIEEGQELSRMTKSGGYFKYETIRKKKDGTLIPVSISGSNIMIDGQLNGVLVIYIDIAERNNILNRLRVSEERYRNLFQNMPKAYYRTDREGNLIMINPEGVKLFGYDSEKDILGENISQYLYFSPEERKRYLKELEKNKGDLKDFEITLKNKKGTLLVISNTSHFYYDIDGNIVGTEGIFVDITERKQNETIQKVLYNISKAANSPMSLDQLYSTIHQELGTIIDATNFYIALIDKEGDNVYFPYHVDEKEDNFNSQELKNGKSLTSYIIENEHSFLLDFNAMKELIIHKKLVNPGVITQKISWLGVPLKIEDRVIGAMTVQGYNNSELYTEKDIELLEFVSSQVATAIERKSTEKKIKYLSFHDSLTGLYNRAYFEEELERYNSPRYYPFSIVMLDINGLKVINDTFGHPEGDKLLKHCSQILISVCRQGDILSRIGGDEFAILLPSATSEQVHEFCERIKKACQQDKVEPVYLKSNISLGHATQEGEYRDSSSLLKEADYNMYQDKLFNSKSGEKYF